MPQQPTVEIPKQLPLVLTPENRDASTAKDSKLVNAFSEKTPEGDYQIYKRPGLLRSSQPSGGAAVGRGMWYWRGDIYSIFGATLYKSGVAVIGTLNATNGLYRFDSCLGGTPKLQMGDGMKAYNYDAGAGLVQITDGDFPVAFVKGWAYLDGTTYVATAAAKIQGDAINDPTSWDPLNFLTAQIEPDMGVGLGKQLVYVVIFKQWSTEIFYDAGNATGSPLGAVQGAKVNYGCAHEGSIAEIDGIFLWISTNQAGNAQVMKMEGLKAEIISSDPVERLLDGVNFSTDTVWSFGFKDAHRFYVVTMKTGNLTLVYDLDENMWTQWTDKEGNYFPIVSVVSDAALIHYMQHESNGRIYTASMNYYTDDGDIITVDLVTPNFDGGTSRRKQMKQMKFIADQVPGSVLQVRKNDNDYAVDKWSNFRYVDMSKELKMLSDCGTFVRRAHNFRHQSNTQFRMRAVEMQIDLGVL